MPTILITGANRGLGLEFARQYAQDGWRVIAACRQPAAATQLQALAVGAPAVTVITLDVADPASIRALPQALPAALAEAGLDVLINNAGIFAHNTTHTPVAPDAGQIFGTLDAEGWLHVLRVNSIAPLLVAEAVLPFMRRGQHRTMVTISSTMGSIERMTESGCIAYRSSKAALNAAWRNVALALQADGLIVTSLNPGWVQTDMGGMNATLTPTESVTQLRQVIAGLTLAQSGMFLSYDGKSVPW
jgi:NAD(P)-dependent dehydrogenase (short-subunit alcohol dehydrogenase family)